MISEWVGFRALVVGCGSIGRRHARNLKSLGVRKLGFCDTSAEALKRCREELQGETFSDYGEALREFGPDMVLICTPPVFHVEEALAALQARAHVFIEKPLSHESGGIQVLIAEARHHDRSVQVGYNMRFHPGLKILKELVDSGKIPSGLASVAALSRKLQRAPRIGRGYHPRWFARTGLHLLAVGAAHGSDLPGGAPQQPGCGRGRFGVDLSHVSGAAAR